MAMKSISIDGATRYYEDEGQGPAVVLVHGSLSNARQWRTLTERLRGRFRLLAPDLYAVAPQGGAPRAGDFSFADDVAFVQRLIDETGGKAHLLGHSWGGVIAVKAAFGRRERLASLILIEPSCFHLLDKSGADYAEIAAIRERERALSANGDTMGAARFFVEYWMGPQAWPAMPPRRQELIASGIPRLYRDWRGAFEANTTLDDYRAFAVRTLLLHARDTRRPSARIVALLGAALPNAESAEIERGGHMSPLTNPEPVNDAIARFLDGG